MHITHIVNQIFAMLIKPSTFFLLKKNVSYAAAHLIRSRKKKNNRNLKKRDLERACYLGMKSISRKFFRRSFVCYTLSSIYSL